MTHLIHAPWTADQVTALNAFQHHGRMHPFTCGAEHASGRSPVLIATNGGWVCPDPQCVYRQDWAHAFMVERGAAVSAAVAPPTTHGLSVQHADALYDAIATPGPGERESFDDQHARVCRVVREILDDLLPAPAEPADQTALRDRIADTLATADGWVFAPGFKAESPTYRGFLRQADAVLAVLPEPADTAAVLADVERAIRAATGSCGYKAEDGCDFCNGVDAALDQLRRMADETATETPAVDQATVDRALDALRAGNHITARLLLESAMDPAAGARQDGTET